MSAQKLLADLESRGVVLRVEGGALRLNAGRGVVTPQLKSAVTDAKDALIALLRERDAGMQPATTTASVGVREISAFQQRLFILDRLDPSSTAYVSTHAWANPRDASLEQIVAAIRNLISRHEILRSVFTESDDVIIAEPRAVDAVPIEIRELTDSSSDDQAARLRADLRSEARRQFDLASTPPVRFVVYRSALGGTATLMAAHHIAIDDWSVRIIERELTETLSGRPAMAVPALQFHQYVARHAAHAGLEHIDWWTGYLRGAPQVSIFPPDRAFSTAVAPEGKSVRLRWSGALANRLRHVVRTERATLYMSMLVAMSVALRWHTGQCDAVFGSPMGVREHSDWESIVGPFVNLLVVRMDTSGDPTFSELLARARESMLEAYARRDTPFERLLDHIRPARSAEHAPLFQIAMVQHNAPGSGAEVWQASGGTLHELTWYLQDDADGISCTLEYRSDLYRESTMNRLGEHLRTILERGIEDPARTLSQLCVLPPEEIAILDRFNATAAGFDGASLLPRLTHFARSQPERVALCFEGSALSYAGLNAAANRLAHRLIAAGARPGVIVGVMLPRTPDLLIALLAVLKSGATYLPLDPRFPTSRLAFMLEDSGARLLINAPDLALPPVTTEIASIEIPAVDGDSGNTDDPLITLSAEEVAYVIYTSGSTGTPKGVEVLRGNLDNFLNSMAGEPGLQATDVLAAVTTVSFDIAGLELFLPLFVGAGIELISRETAANGADLAERLRASGATVMQATPSTWRLLLESGWSGAPGFRAFCGGEPLPPSVAERLLPRVAELWNLYGPTETTIWSMAARIGPEDGITVGHPIANTSIHIVSPAGTRVPLGRAGEICIGGAGVAKGYLNRPELTAERFLDDPFASPPGARLYRTGDQGRWLEDGRLVHLGRLDNQVKIRGFRIELGEIEAALERLPQIRQAAVASREAGAGDQRLVAYVLFHEGEDLTVSDVRRGLRDWLSDYMIPSLVLAVDQLPLTPNGKVDRAQLPDPFAQRLNESPDEGTLEGSEAVIAEIWREILHVDRIRSGDNFFDLGGHSLLSLRVASAIHKRLGWKMDVRTLFFQTLRQIAAAADMHGAARLTA